MKRSSLCTLFTLLMELWHCERCGRGSNHCSVVVKRDTYLLATVHQMCKKKKNLLCQSTNLFFLNSHLRRVSCHYDSFSSCNSVFVSYHAHAGKVLPFLGYYYFLFCSSCCVMSAWTRFCCLSDSEEKLRVSNMTGAEKVALSNQTRDCVIESKVE